MGILNPYDASTYQDQPPGWLGLLLGGGLPGQQQAPTGPGWGDQLPPTAAPAMGAVPQLPDTGQGRGVDQSNPFAALLSGAGNALGSLFSPGQAQAQQAPQGQQQAPQQAGPGVLDRLSAGATNFTTGGNPLAGIFNSIHGLATGQRTDPAGIQQQQVLSTYHALVAAGVQPGLAQAAALNPTVLKDLVPQLYNKPTAEKLKDAFGNERIVFTNPVAGTVSEAGGSGGAGSSPGGPQMLAQGVKQYDPYLPADKYLAQFSPDVQSVMKAQLNGDIMPTGNPRQQQLWSTAKGFTTLYADKAGVPFSDAIYNAKRTMQTELAKSSNSSMGGILANGDSAFKHLAELGGSFSDLGNYAGPNIPGGAHIGDIGNTISNTLFPTPQVKGKLAAVADNTLHYGQESTKFYSATGGGEAERMHALKEVGGGGTNAEVQAAYMEKEKSLMLDRLNTKIEQVRQTLGDDEAQKIIAQKMPSLQQSIAKIDASIAKLRGQGGQGAAAQQQSQQPSAIQDGATATGPNGHKIMMRGGAWIDTQTGQPLR